MSLDLYEKSLERDTENLICRRKEAMKAENSKCHLCTTCVYDYPECSPQVLEFGDGVGNDNVIECDAYESRPEFADGVEV